MGFLGADPEWILVKVRECPKDKPVREVREGGQFKDVVLTEVVAQMSLYEEHRSAKVSESSHLEEHPTFLSWFPDAREIFC